MSPRFFAYITSESWASPLTGGHLIGRSSNLFHQYGSTGKAATRDCLRNISCKLQTNNSFDVTWKNGEIDLTSTPRDSGKCFFLSSFSLFFTMLFVEAQLRAVRKSPVGALRRSDRTCLTFTRKRLLLGLRYSRKEREWRANFIKVKVKLSIGDRIGEKKYKQNDKTLTNKHFILKIVSRLTTLCLNKTWYFGWGTPSFTIFDSY